MNFASGGGMETARAISGNYFPGQCRQFSGGTTTPAIDTIFAIPFAHIIVASGLGVEITAAGSGDSEIRVGIYASGPNGLPSHLIEDCGPYATNAGGTIFMPFLTPWRMLEPYWAVAVLTGAASATYASHTGSGEEMARTWGNATPSGPNPLTNGLTVPFTFGKLPTTFPTGYSALNVVLGLSVRAT
jgi:hypothetical protein